MDKHFNVSFFCKRFTVNIENNQVYNAGFPHLRPDCYYDFDRLIAIIKSSMCVYSLSGYIFPELTRTGMLDAFFVLVYRKIGGINHTSRTVMDFFNFDSDKIINFVERYKIQSGLFWKLEGF